MMRGVIENFLSEDIVQSECESMFGAIPDGPVRVGDMWDQIMSMGGGGFPMDLDTTYVLREVKDGLARIDMTAKFDAGTDGGQIVETMGMKMNMLLSGVMTGQAHVDIDTGRTISCAMTQQFNGTLNMSPSEQMPNGMTIPMRMEGTTTITSEKIK